MKRYQRLILIFILFVVFLSMMTRPVAASGGSTGTQPAPSDKFGAVEAYYRPGDAAEIGVGWDRVIFEWRHFQPNGPYEWKTSHIPTTWLQDAKNSGRQIVGLIKNAPFWATMTRQLGGVPLGLDRSIDDPQNYFAQFVKRLTSYYGAQWGIHHWIIYNEPDIRPEDTDLYEFVGDVGDYYKVLKTAYKAAHAADPQAVIHLAGMSIYQDELHGRQLYLERLMRVMQADPEAKQNNLFFDVLTIHVYNFTQLVWTLTNRLAQYPAQLGFPKPIWIDELNARVTNDMGKDMGGNILPVDIREQASFLVQSTATGLALGAEGILIYRMYDNTPPMPGEAWGLIRHDGTRRPGFDALRLVIREFSATTNAVRVSVSGVRIIRLYQKDRILTVLWNASSTPMIIRTPYVENAQLLSPLGYDETLNHVDSYNEFVLPRCASGCFIEGEPRILKQDGPKAKLYLVVDGGTLALD